MKKTLQLILLCLSVFLNAQKKVNVISQDGLNLRKTASVNGIIIEKIPFGTDLKVIQNTQIVCEPILIFKKDTTARSMYGIGIENDLTLTGTFLKVAYKGKVGYINSLYTCSTIPNLIYLQEKNSYENKYTESEEDFDGDFYLLNKYFKVKRGSNKELEYSKEIDEEGTTTISYTKKYPGGLQYTFNSDYTENGIGGYSFTITSRNLSFNEAIMMARLFFVGSSEYSGNEKIGFESDSKSNTFYIEKNHEGGGTTCKIYRNEQGYWTLEYSSGSC